MIYLNEGTKFWLENLQRADEWQLWEVARRVPGAYSIKLVGPDRLVTISADKLANEKTRGRLVSIIGAERLAMKQVGCLQLGQYVTNFLTRDVRGGVRGEVLPYYVYRYQVVGQLGETGLVWGSEERISKVCQEMSGGKSSEPLVASFRISRRE